MKSCQGWTLSTLLISLALASLLILLFAKTLIFTLEMTRQSVQLAQLQQTGQFALGLLQRELRNGNFMAGVRIGSDVHAEFSVENDCFSVDDSGSFPADNQPFQLTRTGTVGDSGSPTCLSNAINHSDYLQLKRLAGEFSAKTALRQNRVYLAQSHSGLRFVTATSDELASDANYWPYLHQIFYVARQYQQGRAVPVLMRKRLVRQQSGQLAMDTDAVLDGVEAMVFESGFDRNQDGVTDHFTTQGLDNNGNAVTPKVVQIRFHILLRSVDPDPAYTNHQQYQLGPRRFEAPGDHFRRLQLSSSVTLIN